jgi:hypothetical protein
LQTPLQATDQRGAQFEAFSQIGQCARNRVALFPGMKK